jgi:hypothetical protein
MNLLRNLPFFPLKVAQKLSRAALGPQPIKLIDFKKNLILLPNPSNLCWASVVVTGLRSAKIKAPADHCHLASMVLAGCSAMACSSPACNVPIPVGTGLQVALGMRIPATAGPLLSFQEVKNEIGGGSGKPILCEEDGGRHAVLLWGYLDTADQWVYRADPAKFEETDSWRVSELSITAYYRI